MPVPISTVETTEMEVFPSLSPQQIDATRTSQWHELFEDITIPAKWINAEELGEQDAFLHWFSSDSIFLPEGSERMISSSSESGDPGPTTSRNRSRSTSPPQVELLERTADIGEGEEGQQPKYYLPKLNGIIREMIEEYGGVFPKLNWTSPRDAAYMLPQIERGPLFCKTPSDVYLLLKSSDLISHDLDPTRAYSSGPELEEEETQREESDQVRLELVMKEYRDINPSREFRCFVRQNILLGVCQRDPNFYDHLQPSKTQERIAQTIRAFWEDEVRGHFEGGNDYVFDVYLSENLKVTTLIDFNPYRSSTDPLLFTYPELLSILQSAIKSSANPDTSESVGRLPVLKVIDTAAHPDANRNAPQYGGNMMPIEVMEMSQGRNMDEFKEAWVEAVAQGVCG